MNSLASLALLVAACAGPATPTDLPKGVYAIPLATPSGVDQGYFYTADLFASGRSFRMLFDTGSTTVAIAGSECPSCSGISPRYVPGGSAVDTRETAVGEYASETGWAGEVYADDIGLGHGSPAVPVNLVDIEIQSESDPDTSDDPDFFYDGNAFQGILGAGRDDLLSGNATGYVTSLADAGVADKLGIELCPSDGTFWLGGFDPGHASADMVFTPLISSQASPPASRTSVFYAVDMTAMSLGSADVGLTAALAQDPIIDTGTSVFYVPTGVEAQVIAELDADAGFAALFPGESMTAPGVTAGGCVSAGSGVTDAMVDAELPPLTMTFAAGGDGSGSVAITASALRSYLVDSGGGWYCMGMYPGGDDGSMIMGDTFLRGFVTLIDLVDERVGFAPSSYCPAPGVAAAGTTELHRPRERGRGPSGLRASGGQP